MHTPDNHSESTFSHLFRLALRVMFRLFYGAVFGFFALMAFAPVLLIIVHLWGTGLDAYAETLINILFLPLALEGKTTFDGDDIVFAASFWVLVFSGATLLIEHLKGERSLPVSAGFRAVHYGYIALYAIALILVPLLHSLDQSERGAGYATLMLFFVFGYAALWLAWLLRRVLQQL